MLYCHGAFKDALDGAITLSARLFLFPALAEVIGKSDMAKRGRPSKYTKAIADDILQRLAAGESLRGICADENMPAESTVRGWVIDDVNKFSAQYARARDMGVDALAEETIQIADDGRNDTYIDYDADGKQIEKLDFDHIKRSQLRVSARQWYVSKIAPKKYGDKLDMNVSGGLDITSLEKGRDRAKQRL